MKHLFIGGPVHAKMLDVEPIVSIAPDASPEVFPTVWTHLASASSYIQRTVQHNDGETGDQYRLTVYVYEAIQDAQQAQVYLGEALAHQFFVLHGTKLATAPIEATPRLIVPGRS